MILDTNALSALADGTEGIEKAAGDTPVLFVPVIVLGEYRFGIAGSRHRARYETWLTRLLRVSHVLDVDEQSSMHYAAIRRELVGKGRPIPSNDTWVAALARQHRLPVLSRDRHFDEVAGLRRVAW